VVEGVDVVSVRQTIEGLVIEIGHLWVVPVDELVEDIEDS
jgi:hypothetical protein